jgi:hypothetical protein
VSTRDSRFCAVMYHHPVATMPANGRAICPGSSSSMPRLRPLEAPLYRGAAVRLPGWAGLGWAELWTVRLGRQAGLWVALNVFGWVGLNWARLGQAWHWPDKCEVRRRLTGNA